MDDSSHSLKTASLPLAGGRPILYAEDDSDDVYFMRRAFRAAQVRETLQVVPDGELAMAYLAGTGGFADRSRHPLPALVLLDINMPLYTGLEVLEWVRSQNQFAALPVYMLTSSSLEADMNRAKQLGATRYIVKPSHPDGLINLVRFFTGCSAWIEVPGDFSVPAPEQVIAR